MLRILSQLHGNENLIGKTSLKKKLTVYDLLKLKGVRKIHEVFVNNIDEALAAEEAGIDMIVAGYDQPQYGINNTFEDLKRIRQAVPCTHMMSSPTEREYVSGEEAVRSAYKLMDIGIDSIYSKNSSTIIKELRREKVPVVSHVGLVPGNNTWTGGYIAVGKTAIGAFEILNHAKELEDAGVIALEVEVVPTKVAEVITKRLNILTISMGSGSECDAQYLFSQDILGYNKGHIPRHSRIYRNFNKQFLRLHEERVNAYKEFIQDTENKKFNDPKITVKINDKEFEKFLKESEKY